MAQPVSRVRWMRRSGAPFSSGGFAPKEPMNAELVGEVSIDAERHVVQLIEQVWICTQRQLMKISCRSPTLPLVTDMATVFPWFGLRVACIQSVAEDSMALDLRWS